MSLDHQILGLQRELYNTVGGTVELPAWQATGYNHPIDDVLDDFDTASNYEIPKQNPDEDREQNIDQRLTHIDNALEMILDQQKQAERFKLLDREGELTEKGEDWYERTSRGIMKIYDGMEDHNLNINHSLAEVGEIYAVLGTPARGEPEALITLLNAYQGIGMSKSYDATMELLHNEGLIEAGFEKSADRHLPTKLMERSLEDIELEEEENARFPDLTEKGQLLVEEVVIPDYKFLQNKWNF